MLGVGLSYMDFAIALIDEIETPTQLRTRIAVADWPATRSELDDVGVPDHGYTATGRGRPLSASVIRFA